MLRQSSAVHMWWSRLRTGELAPLLTFLAVAGLMLAFGLLADEVRGGGTSRLDTAVLAALRSTAGHGPLGPPWLHEAVRDVKALGSFVFLGLLLTAVVGYLLLVRQRGLALLMLVAVLGGTVMSSLIKIGFDRPRPDITGSVRVFTASSNHGGVTMAQFHLARTIHWRLVVGLVVCAAPGWMAVGRIAIAQTQPDQTSSAPPSRFIEITPTEGRVPVHLAASQVVRVGRLENFTTIDTAAWVQQRTIEPVEAVARRLRDAGQRLIALTDLNHGRVYLSLDRIVLVRDSNERHAAGARAAIVMVGLRFNTDVAVRETAQEVMATIRRDGPTLAPDRLGAAPMTGPR